MTCISGHSAADVNDQRYGAERPLLDVCLHLSNDRRMLAESAALEAGKLASERLGEALQTRGANRSRARVAARILTHELERLDGSLASAQNSRLPDTLSPAFLDLPAWDHHQQTLADLIDDETWDSVRLAASTPPDLLARHTENATALEDADIAVLQQLRMQNTLARAKLVPYAAKLALPIRMVPLLRWRTWRRKQYRLMAQLETPEELQPQPDQSSSH